eukprot:scaffold1786_cov250-Pinguiococcus_pyrenoidosus.AAC.3
MLQLSLLDLQASFQDLARLLPADRAGHTDLLVTPDAKLPHRVASLSVNRLLPIGKRLQHARGLSVEQQL